jgi:hypothetical protein
MPRNAALMLGAIQEILGYGNGYSPDIVGIEGANFGATDLMLGDDDEDALNTIFSGSDPRQNAVAAVMKKIARAKAIDPHAAVLSDIKQTRRRVLQLGITPVLAVAAGATAQVTARTARVFRTEDIVLPDDTATGFELISAFVGQDSQLAGGAPVALDGFSYLSAHRSGVHWDTAYPGIDIVLNVRNHTAGPLDFRGEFKGTAAVR